MRDWYHPGMLMMTNNTNMFQGVMQANNNL